MERAVGVGLLEGNGHDDGGAQPGAAWRVAYIALAGAIALLALGSLLLASAGLAGPRTDPATTWTRELQTVEDALAAGDPGAAKRAWDAAYGGALADRGWQGMLAVGKAALRVGQASGAREAARARAREAYLAALSRARAKASADGAVRVGQAFAALGDREAAEVCFRVADGLAGRAAQGKAKDLVHDGEVGS